MSHVNPEDLLLFHYGESDNAGDIRAHLSTCAHCRAELDSLERTLEAVSAFEVPEVGKDYEESVWGQVRHHLDGTPIHPIQVTPVRRWGWAVGIAASLLFAFMLGRYWPSVPVSERTSSPTDDAVERVLAGELAAHFERTSILLTDVVNTSGNGAVDLGFRRERANELAADSRLLRQTANRRGMRSVTLLLDELERVLIEVANSSPELPGDQYENLRESIEGQDLLFKVRVTSDRIRRGAGDGWARTPRTTI
ncbi:MAG: hypothetical protein AB1752_09950 [Candidatus Zixiibacteriota bacterium]